jgi:hypothetical protein
MIGVARARMMNEYLDAMQEGLEGGEDDGILRS